MNPTTPEPYQDLLTALDEAKATIEIEVNVDELVAYSSEIAELQELTAHLAEPECSGIRYSA